MSPDTTVDLTDLLDAAARGEDGAFDVVFARVYDELKSLARRVRAGRSGATLDTTALVHETWLKLVPSSRIGWQGRAHFFRVAARAMRQILIDAARRELAVRRGGHAICSITYDDHAHATPVRPADLIALDDALARLEAVDVRRARVVEYRVYCGLSTRETAEMLGVSSGTIERDWRAARAFLALELTDANTAS